MNALYLMNDRAYNLIYGPEERADIESMLHMVAPLQTAESIAGNLHLLADVDVIISGWGMARLTPALLDAAPNLQAIFYGAGTIRYFITEEVWRRNIVVTTSAAGNAVPVVEFTLAEILFSLKRGWSFSRRYHAERALPGPKPVIGAYGSTVGLIGLGLIGRKTAEILQQFDLQIIAHDPFWTEEAAAELGVELCSLEEIFARADVVSLHAPWLDETVGMITGAHLASMRDNATFINTARGALVREEEMLAVLQRRPDLFAVLDVTYPEPPVAESPLYTLPNVVLTPHIAGSLGNECRRMGRMVVDDLRRFLNGEPLRWAVTEEQARHMA